MAHQSTTDLVTEVTAPTVQSVADYQAALRVFLPALNRVSQQAAALQALAGVAALDEPDVAIRQKLVGFGRSLQSIQGKHDRTVDFLLSLRDAMASHAFEGRELDRVLNRPDDPPEDPANVTRP